MLSNNAYTSNCGGSFSNDGIRSNKWTISTSLCIITLNNPQYVPLIIPVSVSGASADVNFEIYTSTDTSLGTLAKAVTHTPTLTISSVEIPIPNRPDVKQITIKHISGSSLELS